MDEPERFPDATVGKRPSRVQPHHTRLQHQAGAHTCRCEKANGGAAGMKSHVCRCQTR